MGWRVSRRRRGVRGGRERLDLQRTKVTENDSIEDKERKTNEWEFVGTNVMEDEALSYEREEKEKTTHNVCTRQIMDDANRLKYSKYQQKK